MTRKTKRTKKLRKPKPSFLRTVGFVASLVLIGFFTYHTLQQSLRAPKKSSTPSRRASVSPARPARAVTYIPASVRSWTETFPRERIPYLQTEERLRALGPDALPPRERLWTSRPKLVFVIDDIGHHKDNERLLRRLRDNVTYAILPHLRYSKYFSQTSRLTGAEVILHQPLEADDGRIPGPGLIVRDMKDSHILEVLDHNLDAVPYHVGMNNHMGSRGSADRRVMELLLRDLKHRNMFFLDSYTTSQAVSREVGSELGLPVLKRDVFLDNVDEPEAIRQRVKELALIARKKGSAIAIGHDRAHTLSVLYEEIPALLAQGYQIVSLSDFVSHQRGS